MIAVKCNEHLRAVEAFADSIGRRDALQEALHYLGSYANRPGCIYEKEGTRCQLFPDFAPYSFGFTMFHGDGKGGWKYWFQGGLIYNGPSAPGDGSFPSLSVSLSASDQPRWEVHT